MAYPGILTAGNKTTIRAGNFNVTPYILKNPNAPVFTARVNQATFASPFATVEFDNITTGAITDVLDGFTVYIGTTTDIRQALFVGRARGDGAAGTTLNINETDAALVDDMYITVVQDVAAREKLGRYVNKTMTVDWDITFRQLLPRVTGLQSAYGGKLAGGQADFTFPAVGNVSNSGAAISSWLWNADGGAFINGTVATDAQPDIRYTVAGVYWPRVTVTDDGGREGWFTMPVFVMSADMSDSFIITGADNLAITSQLETGAEMRFTYFSDEMEDVAERTLVALWNDVWYDGNTTAFIDNIVFVGRLRREESKNATPGNDGPQPETPFICEDILAQMNRLRSPQLALTSDQAPATFGEIATMTQWRIASFVLTEFSTVPNVASLSFDIEDNTYRNKEDNTEDQSLLASINGILSARKAALNVSRQGEIYGARNANFQTDVQRNALDTITTLTNADTFTINIPRDTVPVIGRIGLYGGAYNTTDNTLRIIRANAPAIASKEAQGIGSPVNGVLLASDATLATQKAEAEQLVADALADANPKDLPTLDILDGYFFLSPNNFQWYGYLLAATENNRGIVYDATDRFLLINVNLRFDGAVNSWDATITLSHETQGGDAQTISQLLPDAIEPGLPNIPPVPAYPGFPAPDTIFLPTGWTTINIPPISQGDAAIIISPLEPFAIPNAQTLKGSVVAQWDASEVFLTLEFTETDVPDSPAIFEADAPMLVKDFKFDPHNHGAYVLVNDGAGNSEVWRTSNVFESEPEWTAQATTLDDIDYTTIRTTAIPGEVYIFGLDDRIPPALVELLDGNGNAGLSGSALITPHVGSADAPGRYADVATDYYYSTTGDPLGIGCNIQYSMPARALLTHIDVDFECYRVGITEGTDKTCEVSLDGVSLATMGFGAGVGIQNCNINQGFASLPGSTLLFHSSIDKAESSGSVAKIIRVDLTFADGGDPKTAFRRSDDYGNTLSSLINSGVTIDSAAVPGYDTGAIDTFAYLPADDILRETDDYGITLADKTDSDTAATYAAALWAYGKTADADMVIASAAAFGGVTLIKVVANVAADITPDDGLVNGIIVGRNALCMSRISDTHIWGIFDYGGTPQLTYSDDGGTSWTLSAEALTGGAVHMRVKNTNTSQLYIADSTVIKYSDDGGATFENDRISPSAFILGVEVR